MVGVGDIFALTGLGTVVGTVVGLMGGLMVVVALHDASCFSKGAFPL
jgi:hypothetical protein